MKKRLYFIWTVALVLVLSACDDWLTVEPETAITGEKLFTTNEGVNQSLNGLYLNMRGLYYPEGRLGGAGQVENMGCTYTWATGNSGYMWAGHYYSDQPDNTDNAMIFKGLYNIIANANSLIEGTGINKEKLKEEVYNIARGEALAIRALAHLDLIRIYGPVPTKVNAAETYLPYVRVNNINPYEYITYEKYMGYLLADLDSAEVLLAKSDPVIMGTFEATEVSSATWSFRKNHINYYGVLGLQARARLWTGDMEGALRYARLVKEAKNEDGTFKLRLMNPDDNTSEGIFNNTTTDLTCYCEHLCGTKCDNYDYTQGTAWQQRNISVVNNTSTFLNDLYSGNGDDLRYQWFWSYNNRSQWGLVGYYCRKYLSFYNSSPSPKNFPIMRLAEIYLIIAENAPLAEANAAYEEYCNARNIPYVALMESDRGERILMEFIREFTGEGQNFYTYKRHNVQNMLFGVRPCTEEQYRLVIPSMELISD